MDFMSTGYGCDTDVINFEPKLYGVYTWKVVTFNSIHLFTVVRVIVSLLFPETPKLSSRETISFLIERCC